MSLAIVAALADNGVIGRDNQLPWHLSNDLRHFKSLTTGHTIVMGRKTFDSLGRVLPDRRHIVLTRDPHFEAPPGVTVVDSFEKAISAIDDDEAFVIGGSAVFESALPHADTLYLTRVHADVEGDVRFPDVDWSQWTEVSSKRFTADERNDFDHTIRTLTRKTA